MSTIKELIEKQTTINENVDKVHAEGYTKGEAAGFEAGAMPLYYAKKLDYLWNGVAFPDNYEMSVRFKELSTIDYAFMESKNLKSVRDCLPILKIFLILMVFMPACLDLNETLMNLVFS